MRCERMARRAAHVVSAALLIGRGSSAPSERPADFALTVSHESGSVPPPYHIEWTFDVRADGRGEIEYLPDYPGTHTPHWREHFRGAPAALDRMQRRRACYDDQLRRRSDT